MTLNFNFNSMVSKNSKTKGEFVLFTNKKTGIIDIVKYEIERKPVLVLKQKGEWLTPDQLRKKFKYATAIDKKELESIIKKAKNVEDIKTLSNPTRFTLNFKL
jgi:hypothetical protein